MGDTAGQEMFTRRAHMIKFGKCNQFWIQTFWGKHFVGQSVSHGVKRRTCTSTRSVAIDGIIRLVAEAATANGECKTLQCQEQMYVLASDRLRESAYAAAILQFGGNQDDLDCLINNTQRSSAVTLVRPSYWWCHTRCVLQAILLLRHNWASEKGGEAWRGQPWREPSLG